MKKLNLNGIWQFRAAGDKEWLAATVPGSVYADLLALGRMDDPFYRDNEMKALPLMEKDYEYVRNFEISQEELSVARCMLVCEGLDTLATVTLNDTPVFVADNMHVCWRKDVKTQLRAGENTLRIYFKSPTRWIAREVENRPIEGATDAMRGYPHLRKAHCMFGWDWGPRLPDIGIWRDIYLEIEDIDCRFVQPRCMVKVDENDGVLLEFQSTQSGSSMAELSITLTHPDGTVQTFDRDTIMVQNPKLWWPRGLGEQPLYTVRAEMRVDNMLADIWEKRIGLRKLDIEQSPDQWGESFALRCNGLKFFSMGANYIPEDNILSRMSPERTRRLLEDACAANLNTIRVWGGGIYPPNYFYDICDELGLVVWQDMMFACSVYDLTPEFDQSIRTEIAQNYNRIRHHACLGVVCANNEIEEQMAWFPSTPKQKGDYLRIFEYIIPETLREQNCDHFFWPSSPSSGGSFDDPQAEERGDVHYWQVWHGLKPFPEYRKHFFRFVSEFGFQSFPCLKTIEAFTLPEDRNIFSYMMEKHQRNGSANGRILSYLSEMYLYPYDFERLLYLSQLLQADAIRYGVEHWRRNRPCCMGAIYWQLNDCWPVASWASIDYYGRWKALHYYARRFFAPVLLSCEEDGTLTQNTNINAEGYMPEKSIRLSVSNETRKAFRGDVIWSLRRADASEIRGGRVAVVVPPMSVVWLDKVNCGDADTYSSYCSYTLLGAEGAEVSSGSALFCAPKHFHFVDPKLEVSTNGDGNSVTVKASAYARAVELVCENGDVLLEDNFFDMNTGERSVRILRSIVPSGEKPVFRARSVWGG